MSNIHSRIQEEVAAIVKQEYGVEVESASLPVQETRKDFEGDVTLVVFPLTKFRLGAPPQIAEKIGAALLERMPDIKAFNVVKGFLNLSLTDDFWIQFLTENGTTPDYFRLKQEKPETIVVEYCSPNTNKPLHLGHLRNIVLGYSLTEILKAAGHKAIPNCLFNDRGTNISKSMYAYQRYGNGETPAEAGKKGDKLVGDYYVEFAKGLEKEVESLMASGLSKDKAKQQAPSQQAIQDMTVKWENGDPEVRALWEKMNGWVYEAYDDTFQQLGVSFDHFHYESKVYQRGRETVAEGLEKGIFVTEEDGSVSIDLTEDGLDKKTLLRSNGTTLYITQDLAIAEDKSSLYDMDRSVYVVGNEQDYHFKVLFKVLEKLEKPYAEGLYHLSYGMVDLPAGMGKMKSREGTTVEIDDLLAEVQAEARKETEKNLAKVQDMDESELSELFRKLGNGAVKYYLIKVDPRKRIVFDPNESVALKGNTGPYIQYAYARIQSVKRKGKNIAPFSSEMKLEEPLLEAERVLLKEIVKFPMVLAEAAEKYNPALLANYAYDLTKEFNRFYGEAPILKSEHPNTSSFRFALAGFAGETLKATMALLGIEMPERM